MSAINLDNKYLFHEENYSLKCKRYGMEWREFIGDKAVGRLYGFALELRDLLKMAKCPNCDGSGAIPHQVADQEWEAEQCQWCDEVKQILETGDDTQTPTAD